MKRRASWFTTKALLAAFLIVAARQMPAQTASSASAGPSGEESSGSTSNSSLRRTLQGDFSGSVPQGTATAESLALTFSDAIARGLRQNLGVLLAAESTQSARAQKWKELSNLLPNLSTRSSEQVQQQSLAAFGFNFPGLPTVIGPFSYFDTRAYLSQFLFNWQNIERQRAALQGVKAANYILHDARELVVLAVGNAYLRAQTAESRVTAADAQVETAKALFQKAADQQKAGVTPAIDTLRAQVEYQARQQQLIVARNNAQKEKLALSRVIGLPLGQPFTLADKMPYQPFDPPTLEECLHRAYSSRQDYQAALSQVAAGELSLRAAKAERYPTLDAEGDYGLIGKTPGQSNGTFHVVGTLSIPIFQGGRAHADVLQADATLRQNRERLEDLRGSIDTDVRTALLDLGAATEQVEVARSSVDLAGQTLTQAQDRFAAGVADNLEVIQAQEALATANENFISSLYAHNIAKVSLARAIGFAEEGVRQYLKGQ